MNPTLIFVIPCFNEAECFAQTAEQVLAKREALVKADAVSSESAVLFVDDGSTDSTWKLIREVSEKTECVRGISLARNYGHQTALYAGLLEAKDKCDVAISLDADGQHDIAAVDQMLAAYAAGNDIVCAVRKGRGGESVPKRIAANLYYYLIKACGIKLIKGHADYRLVSSAAINALEAANKSVLFLRGDFLKLRMNYTTVEYACMKRIAGRSGYSLRKRLQLAINGFASNGVLVGLAKGNAIFEIAEQI